MTKTRLSNFAQSICNTISGSDFYTDGCSRNAIEQKTRDLIHLYEMHIQAHGEDYITTPLLMITAVEYVAVACCIRDLRAATRHSMSIEHDVQLKRIIKATCLEANLILDNLKKEMQFQETPQR